MTTHGIAFSKQLLIYSNIYVYFDSNLVFCFKEVGTITENMEVT